MEKLETLCSTGGNVKRHIMENSTVAPQKVKNRITIWSSTSTPSKRRDQRGIYTPMFTAAVFVIAKR